MQQVQYGSQLSGALLDKPIGLSDDELKELLQAQLSHSNGIRGFMVSYLTSDDETEDSFHVPNVLVEALKEQVKSCPDELVPLTCTYICIYRDRHIRYISWSLNVDFCYVSLIIVFARKS